MRLETLGGVWRFGRAQSHREFRLCTCAHARRVSSQWPYSHQSLTQSVPHTDCHFALDFKNITHPDLGQERPQAGQEQITLQRESPFKGQIIHRSFTRPNNDELGRDPKKATKGEAEIGQRLLRLSKILEKRAASSWSCSGHKQALRYSVPPQLINKARRGSSAYFSCIRSRLNHQGQFVPIRAGPGTTEKIFAYGRELSTMDSSQPAEAVQASDGGESKPAAPLDPSRSEGQQKKVKTPKPQKNTPATSSLPLSPALIDLRVGHILRCIPHENADSLYVSTIAMGDAEGSENTHKDEETGRIVRTVCSGLRGLIPLEQMQDRKVVVMANLKPVNMRGIKSAAMVLAASPPPKEGEDAHTADRVVELVSPPEGSEGGQRVYFEGWEYGEGKGPEKVLNPKKKQWETVQPGLYTSEELTVVFDAGRVQAVAGDKGELVVEGGKGKCVVPSLRGAKLS